VLNFPDSDADKAVKSSAYTGSLNRKIVFYSLSSATMDRFAYTLLTGDKQYNIEEEIIALFALRYGLQHRRLEKNAR
jgi:hypothetical protein